MPEINNSVVDSVVAFAKEHFGAEVSPEDASKALRSLPFAVYLDVPSMLRNRETDAFQSQFGALLNQVQEFVSPGTAAGATSVATKRAAGIQDQRTDTAIQRSTKAVPGAPDANTVKPGQAPNNSADELEDVVDDLKGEARQQAVDAVKKQLKLNMGK